jgi:hypothetical protein
VAPNAILGDEQSFLLELLHFAGWRLQVRRGRPARIRATRNSVQLDVTGSSVAEAAGIVFARAMRSSRDAGRAGTSER